MKVITYTIVILACLLAGWWAWSTVATPTTHPEEITEESPNTYLSDQYGFLFTVADKDIYEYTPEMIAIGHLIPDGFDADMEVNIMTSDAAADPMSYDEFVFEVTKNMCAADGPNETIYCDQIIDQQEFTNAQGLSGTVFFQRRIHENFATGERTEGRFGPIYTFDIGANVLTADHAAIFLRPSAVHEEGDIDEVLVRSVVDSLKIDRTETR